jgi:hypothetical protein
MLPKPIQRNFDEAAKYPRLGYWQVTEEFEHNGHLCLAAYDPAVTCWYLARPLDKPDATFLGYYPYTFAAFVDSIQRELDG